MSRCGIYDKCVSIIPVSSTQMLLGSNSKSEFNIKEAIHKRTCYAGKKVVVEVPLLDIQVGERLYRESHTAYCVLKAGFSLSVRYY